MEFGRSMSEKLYSYEGDFVLDIDQARYLSDDINGAMQRIKELVIDNAYPNGRQLTEYIILIDESFPKIFIGVSEHIIKRNGFFLPKSHDWTTILKCMCTYLCVIEQCAKNPYLPVQFTHNRHSLCNIRKIAVCSC